MSPYATSPRFIIHNPPLPSRSSTNPDQSTLSDLGNSPNRPFNGPNNNNNVTNAPGSGPRETSINMNIPHLDIPPSGRPGARSYSRGEKGMREREMDREADRERQRLQDIDSAKSMCESAFPVLSI